MFGGDGGHQLGMIRHRFAVDNEHYQPPGIVIEENNRLPAISQRSSEAVFGLDRSLS